MNTMLVQLTVGELVELLKEEFPILSQKETKSEEKVALPGEGPTFAGRLVYGIHGIRGLFGVSHKTAHEWKKTWLQPAVKQYGRNNSRCRLRLEALRAEGVGEGERRKISETQLHDLLARI